MEDFLHESTRAANTSSYADREPQIATEPRYSDDDHDKEDEASQVQPGRRDDWGVERDQNRADEKAFARRGEYTERSSPKEKRSYKGLIIGLIAVLALGGAGYGVWANKDKLQELSSSLGRSDAPASGDSGTAQQPDGQTPPAGQTAGSEQPQTGETQTGQQPSTPEEQKMTQRLMPDGSEVDDGPSGGQNGLGEGKSTAASTPVPNKPIPRISSSLSRPWPLASRRCFMKNVAARNQVLLNAAMSSGRKFRKARVRVNLQPQLFAPA